MSPPRHSGTEVLGLGSGQQWWPLGEAALGRRGVCLPRCEGSDEAQPTEWGSPLTRQEAYGESSVSVVSFFPLVTKESEGGRGHEVRSSNPHAVPTVFSLLDQKTRNGH